MSTITIESITFNPAPTAPILVNFKYRENGDIPWILLNGGIPVTVPITGILSTPIPISGLTAGTTYNVSAQTTCGTGEWISDYTTAEEACPNIEDIEALITN